MTLKKTHSGVKPRHTFGRKLISILASVLMVITSLVMLPTLAHAANQVQIDKLEFVTQSGETVGTIGDGTKQWLEVDMSISGPAVAPVSGTISLPGELLGEPEHIILYAPNGSPNGYCMVQKNRSLL